MRKVVMLIMAIVLSISHLWAQQRTITGKVTDDKGAPIPGASVVVKGTNAGTSTNTDGSFSISVPAKATRLVVSFVNMQDVEIDIGNQSVLNVTMQTSAKNLQEVVVTSLGIARDKRSLGYSIQNLKGEELANKGEVNIINALRERLRV